MEKDVVKNSAEESVQGQDTKKMQNLLSACILLAGLFIGSLFVDVAQLVAKEGFSPRALKNMDVVQAAGKTWVAYTDPQVNVEVITDSSCGEQCNPDQALVWLRRALPTVNATKVEYNDEAGKKLAEESGIVSLPAFVFSKDLDKTAFYTQAAPVFEEKGGKYVMNTAQIGLPAGKWLQLPEIKEDDAQMGPKDAKVKIVEFSDFQCPYCQAFHPVLKQALDQYKDKVTFVYKHLPLSFHPQANNAALASECANEQGKFFEYGDKLFAKQTEWSKTEGTQKFKDYAAQMGLKTSQFSQCLDDKKYQDKIDADSAEGAKFGVSGTPGTFVNGQFIGGLTTLDQVKQIIDTELAK